MAGYRIEVSTGEGLKETVLSLWGEYLPGTCPERYDWLNNGNPAGKTLWLSAYSEKNGELAGIMSVMPRDMYCEGKHLKAGITGDFMVLKKYRAFGPGLILPKYVISNRKRLGFDIIYTLPNFDSKKIMEKSGFNSEITLQTLVRPVHVHRYLNRYINEWIAKVVGKTIDIGLMPLSLYTYAIGGTSIREETDADESFDTLWESIKSHEEAIIGDRSAAYLRWRYLENPQYEFRLLALRQGDKLLGFLVYIIEDEDMHVFDISGVDNWSCLKLLNKAAAVARQKECKAIFTSISMSHPHTKKLSGRTLRLSIFMDAKSDWKLSVCADPDLIDKSWALTRGDRNI